MIRRTFIKQLGVSTLTLPFLSCNLGTTADKKGKSKRPNILFIGLDDLNDWVGCMGGNTMIKTPNIDRLASEGTLFTRAFCAAPACTPSRTSMLTGYRPSSSGVYDNMTYYWRDNPALKDTVTLPQFFRENGYRSMGGGKIFHALSWISESYGTNQNDDRSWDDYFPSIEKPMPDFDFEFPDDTKDTGALKTWEPYAKGNTGRRPVYYFDWEGLDIAESETSDYKVAQWAGQQLKQLDESQPFFLAMGIFHPHIPWYVPKKYYELYPLEEIKVPLSPDDDLSDLPPMGVQMASGRRGWHKWLFENGLWKHAVQGYMASISYADAQIGRVLDVLDNSIHKNNTIVVLWSDHGFHLGEKQTWEKFTLWEEAGRVPLIIKVPGLTQANSRCDEPASLLDLYPTLAELCNLPVPKHVEGRSLVSLLKQPNQDDGRTVVTTFGVNNHAVRSKRWRYIRYHDGSEELYDHDHDPGEFYNLAGKDEYQSVISRLAQDIPTVNVDEYVTTKANLK